MNPENRHMIYVLQTHRQCFCCDCHVAKLLRLAVFLTAMHCAQLEYGGVHIEMIWRVNTVLGIVVKESQTCMSNVVRSHAATHMYKAHDGGFARQMFADTALVHNPRLGS